MLTISQRRRILRHGVRHLVGHHSVKQHWPRHPALLQLDFEQPTLRHGHRKPTLFNLYGTDLNSSLQLGNSDSSRWRDEHTGGSQ